MNLRFTHRELTLVIGIIVAMIVAVTLWMNHANTLQGTKKSDAASTQIPGAPKKAVLKLRMF